MTWSPIEHQLGGIDWGYQSVDTPSGRYTLDGPHVLRVSADGSREETVYSTEHLEQDSNVWVQRVSIEDLGDPREFSTQPLEIVYDNRTGNVVLALGLQGVVVGTPDGRWINAAVGQFEPADFSFVGKTRLLLLDLSFWTPALVISLSMTGAALTASQHRVGELFWGIPIALAVVAVGTVLVPYLTL